LQKGVKSKRVGRAKKTKHVQLEGADIKERGRGGKSEGAYSEREIS